MQTINFYLDSYRPKPLSFDSRFALVTIVVSLIGLLVIGWLQSNEVSDLQQRLVLRKTQSDSQQQQLIAFQKELKTHAAIQDLQKKLIASRRELSSYQKIINMVNLPVTSIPVDFSKILSDLSKQTVDSLWLTKISIQAHNLTLSGATTQAKLIPLYVDQIKQAHSLKRHFDELKIERPNEGTDNNSQLITFELINGRLINE